MPDDTDEETPGQPAGQRVMLKGRADETEAEGRARWCLEGQLTAAMSIQSTTPAALRVEIEPLVDALAKQSAAVNAGDLKSGAAMLASQAATLDALFHSLLRRGVANATDAYIDPAETYLRLAFAAQGKSRQCWEAIGELQNPRTVAFVKADQANIAAGHQQVNNARGENVIPPNELNGRGHDQAMDAGITTPAIGANQTVATMGPLDGATVPKGQGAVVAERIQGKHPRVVAPSRKATPGD
jgi:hypothetical protein